MRRQPLYRLIKFCLLINLISGWIHAANPTVLYLEVSLSGEKTNEIRPFLMYPENHLKATRGELTQLGLKIPGTGAPDELIELDKKIGITYDYDVAQQTLNLIVPDAYRTKKIFSASEYDSRSLTPSATGFFLNYSIFTNGSLNWSNWDPNWSSNSLVLEGHFFSPIGTFTQSGFVTTSDFSSAQVIRQDTSWIYSDPKLISTWRAGDLNSGALTWTAPIRMAGLQLRRNFATRPDIVLTAMPTLSGSAALPSTVDILVNNELRYTQNVGSGPFQINNLPTFSGPGQITMLIKDATGRIIQTQLNYFATPTLLKKGLFDYSVEAGFARLSIGTNPFDYNPNPLGSASVRYGFNNYLTGDFHTEEGAGLLNGGFGLVTNIVPLSTVGLAAAGSYFRDLGGLLVSGNWLFQLKWLSLNVSTRRNFFNYANLSIATQNKDTAALGLFKLINATATDQATLSTGYAKWGLGMGFSTIHTLDTTGADTWTLIGSLSQSFGSWFSLNANVYSNFGANQNLGFFAGLNVPLGQTYSSSGGVTESNGQWSGQAQITKNNSGQAGDFGWQLYGQEMGTSRTLGAGANYLGSKGTLYGQTSFTAPTSTASLQLDGSMAIAGGGFFLGNKITDSFAVVNAGGPDVNVKAQGRNVGKTGKSGRLLAPGLQAFQPNKIELDLSELPIMAESTETEATVVPKDKTGVVVEFGKLKIVSGAIVILTDPRGKFIPIGNAVLLDGNSEIFVVGLNGESYITGLGPKNTIRSFFGDTECSAQFDYQDDPNKQQIIGPLICNPK